jgi:hypothetical protein
MARRHVRAMSADSARRKATNKSSVVAKVNYIKGTKDGRMKTYDVWTRKRKRK